MLAWLVITAARVWPRRSFRSSSRPTRNMKKTSPIWLNALRKPRLTGGNSCVEQIGRRPAEQRGPEHDAGEHLSHHARLAEDGDRAANEPRRDQNARDLREQQQDVGHQTPRRP